MLCTRRQAGYGSTGNPLLKTRSLSETHSVCVEKKGLPAQCRHGCTMSIASRLLVLKRTERPLCHSLSSTPRLIESHTLDGGTNNTTAAPQQLHPQASLSQQHQATLLEHAKHHDGQTSQNDTPPTAAHQQTIWWQGSTNNSRPARAATPAMRMLLVGESLVAGGADGLAGKKRQGSKTPVH